MPTKNEQPSDKDKKNIQIGDVVLFRRANEEDYEFYQLTDEKQNIPYTGFPQIAPQSLKGQALLNRTVGDEFKIQHFKYTIDDFCSPEDALYRLMAADEKKENLNYVHRGDYVLSSQPNGLEVIRWGLIKEADLNVLGIRCFHNTNGVNELPESFEVGETYYRTDNDSPIKVESAISGPTFQKRFGIIKKSDI